MEENQQLELNRSEEKLEVLSQEDKMALELAKMNKRLAIASVENAELHYKYVVLQIYMKYGLTQNDAIDEHGNINRNSSNLTGNS